MNPTREDVRSAYGSYVAATAAGSGDNTKMTLVEVDRVDANGGIAMSAILVVPYTTTLAQAETLSLTLGITDCATSSGSYSTATSLLAKTAISTGGTGGSTNTDVYEVRVDLRGYNRYLKFEVTPDLSASGTDTAKIMPLVILCDHSIQPATANTGG